MSDYDFTTIDDDLLLAGRDGYAPSGGGGGNVFWSMKANTTRTFYFVTDLWTANEDHGWWNWREIYAQEGLAGGIMLPGGMRAFAVNDQERYVDADGITRRRDLPLGADELLALVVPFLPTKTKATRPFRPVSDRVGVNIVEVADDGALYHKVLVLTGARGVKLKKHLLSIRNLMPEFTALGLRWQLSVSGTGATENVDLLKVDGAPPIELPEPFDIPALLQEQREQVLAFVAGHTGADVTGIPEWAAEPQEESITLPEAPSSVVPVASRADLYASMTDTRLKTLLTKAGIGYEPKATREQLLELAVANNI